MIMLENSFNKFCKFYKAKLYKLIKHKPKKIYLLKLKKYQ